MRAQHADRLWAIAGALAAAALLAVGWFLLVSPQQAETRALDEQVADAQVRVTTLQKRLDQLREQKDKLPEYEAQLKRNREALPTTSSMPDFLRQLETAGKGTGVSVSRVNVEQPVAVAGTATQVFELPISLRAEGTAGKLDTFLDQLQRVQPRAVLISDVNATAGEHGVIGLDVRLKAFVAPAIGN